MGAERFLAVEAEEEEKELEVFEVFDNEEEEKKEDEEVSFFCSDEDDEEVPKLWEVDDEGGSKDERNEEVEGFEVTSAT